MLRSLFFVCALSALTASAETPKLGAYVRSLLPAEIQSIEPGRTSKSEIEARLGKAPRGLSDGTSFYQVKGTDADLTVGYRDGVVRYLIYAFTSEERENDLNLEHFKAWITPEQKRLWKNDAEKIPARHESMRFMTARFPEESVELRFRDAGEMGLFTLMLWKQGVKEP